MQRERQKYLRKLNSKIGAYILDQGSVYSNQALDNIERFCYNSKIYVLQILRICELDWYRRHHFYLNHPGGSRPVKTIRGVCYWKGLVTQSKLYSKPCKICQQLKNRKTLHGRLPPKNTAELKPWVTVHV